jgi:SAM-dependent methyltransferase
MYRAAVLRRLRPWLQSLYEAADSDYREQILGLVPGGPELRLLDLGCDDGSWTARLQETMGIPPGNVAGLEAVDERAELARARGFDVRAGDLEESWPLPESSFDVVHANQVIEHVKRLDHFVSEVRRVLRPNGTAVICTENLASWHNVAALVAGFMPFSAANVSATGPIGNPFALHAGEPSDVADSWQHVHVLTTTGLRGICEAHGLRVERIFASGYHPAFGRAATRLARWDPRHAHFIGAVARPE